MATRASNRGVRARGSKGRGKSGGAGPSRMPPQLRQSYLTGKVAARIGWGSPGDGTRCLQQAAGHRVPKRMRGGMCQRLHIAATGQPMGKHGGRR